MFIKWIGHACFKITLKSGPELIMDPFDDGIGLTPLDEKADIVIVSHPHHDHCNTDGVKGEYILVDKPGEYEIKDIKIQGFTESHGGDFGETNCFLVEARGIRILHLGDIGVVPEDDFFEKIGRVDILMLPVGGRYTVGAKDAFQIMEKIEPNITIPMHYMVPGLTIDIAGVHEFLELAGREYDISRLGNSVFEIYVDNLKKRQRIMIMEHSN